LKSLEGLEFEVLKYEFKDGLNKYLAKHNATAKSLQDIIAFDSTNEAKAMPFFKQEILQSSQAKGDLNSKDYLESVRKLQDTTRKAIDDILKEHQLVAICGPTNGPSWCIDLINGDSFTGYGMYSPAAVAGYPSLSVPMGLALGLPVGLCFLGAAWSEPELIEVGYAYEQASMARVLPSFKPTAYLSE
jgi:amidase